MYSDASVPLRALLEDDQPPLEWASFETGFTSALFSVEARRTLDRLRVSQALSDAALAGAMFKLLEIERSLAILDVTNAVLERASRPMPTSLRTLGTIHVATALILREEFDDPGLVFATHDRQQAIGARALGFEVVGIEF